jgi:GSCFA family.
MPEELHKQYNYGVYSARYGNIYTVRQLLLLFKEALGEFAPIETFWPKGEGYVDPFRPTIEPHPHVRLEELKEFRMFHLQKVRELFETCEVFIFTLGLTEAWENIQDGAVYPIVPGTKSGGVFDKTKYCLHNFNYVEIMEDLQTFYGRLLEINPNCKMILTVSPVPLAATAGSEHVLCATMYSKSVLRAVAGDFCNKYDTVDYFPSYELINSPVSKGFYFMADGRSISSAGVREVMSHFFMAHGLNQPKMIKNIDNEKSGITPQSPKSSVDFEAQCDEEILMLEAGTN